MQAAELFFLLSSVLQWWLVADAGRLVDHLAWASHATLSASPSYLSHKPSTQLVFTWAHKSTKLALAAQASSSLLLTVGLAVGMLLDQAPLLLDIVLVALRLLVLACNAAFMWESAQAWRRESAAKKVGNWAHSTAMDTELYLLASCLLLLVWQVLHTCVSSGSVPLLAILVSIHAGGAAVLRAFAATLLLWAPGAQLSQSIEAGSIHAQLQAWWPPHLQDQGPQEALSRKAKSVVPGSPGFTAQYLAAVANTAARLLAPATLSRAQALQDISCCRASVSMLLQSSLPRKSAEKPNPALLHALQGALHAAAIVRNHNQLHCCSIIYTRESDPQSRQALPSYVVQSIAPHHLQGLFGRDRFSAESDRRVQLSMAQVLPILLNLGKSQPCPDSPVAISGHSAACVHAAQLVPAAAPGHSAQGKAEPDDASCNIVACDMRPSWPRSHEDSFSQSTAVCISSQLHGRSPSAHLTIRQLSCGASRPSASMHKAGTGGDRAALGPPDHPMHDHLPRSTSKGSQSHRLTVYSAASSFRAASGLRASEDLSSLSSDEKLPECSEPLASGGGRFTACHALLLCANSTAAPHTDAREPEVVVKALQLRARDATAICSSLAPSLTGQPPSGADVRVHIRMLPPLQAATVPGDAVAEPATPTGPASATRPCSQSLPASERASPEMLKHLMDLVAASDTTPAVVMRKQQLDAKESCVADNTGDLAARTVCSAAERPSMLHHIYSASPAQAKSQQRPGSSTIEIEPMSGMSVASSCAMRPQAHSAALSQDAGSRHDGRPVPACSGSPVSDTVSILSHSIPPVESPRQVAPGRLSQSVADSTWLQLPAARRTSGGSSGLLHADSSSAWVPRGRRRAGGARQGDNNGGVQPGQMVVSAALTDGSRQSIGAPTRSYLEQEPRHTFGGTTQQANSGPARAKFMERGSEGAIAVCSITSNKEESDALELQLAENAASMMLPMPPSEDMFL
eukprot:jgi/Ulvmu1/4871/UM020_0157.1